ncbi:MAG: ATP-binding cassette domain-containing protein [Acetobacteraceae bacterium]
MEQIVALFGDRPDPAPDHPAYSLSYANRRRVEIARALALTRGCCCWDEPTAGMNETETAEMQAIIGQLKAGGQTILLIEHKLTWSCACPTASSRWMTAPRSPRGRRPGPARTKRSSRPISAITPWGRRPPSRERLPAGTGERRHVLGPVQVHFGLTVQVRRGQIVCLLGGNASGKSTTMKVILGLVRPRAGQVTFDGQPILGLSTPADHPPRHRLRAGGAAAVRRHDGAGEPADGRLRPHRPRRDSCATSSGCWSYSPACASA